jgi:uncharacterized protein YgiM (DUF1202 family)
MKRPAMLRRRPGGWLALALLMAGSAFGLALATTAIVTAREAKIRAKKTLLGSTIPGGDVKEGDRVTVNSQEDPWFNVTFGTVTGWLHGSALTDRKGVVLSGQADSVRYTGQDVSAGKKGFNEDVERAYKTENPNLAGAFAEVDRIQATKIPEEELVKFAEAGKLKAAEGGR